MLLVTVPQGEIYDPKTRMFVYTSETVLRLEHSLVSLSKWESRWKVPFLNREHPSEMFDDYIRCMTITQNVDPNVYLVITNDIRKRVKAYIEESQTAAVVNEAQRLHQSRQFVTSDLIYYWMTALNIPFEPCQKWHLSRLMMLIKIANVENKSGNKMSKADSAKAQHAQNAARRAKRKKH